MRTSVAARFRFAVIPAKAGIHVDLFQLRMGPGLRRDDDGGLT